MNSVGTRQIDKVRFVQALAPVLPSTSAGVYVSLKNYNHVTVLISVKNATTVTGSAITLKQATAVAGTNEKELAFTKVWANIDTAASDNLVETAVVSNTFTTNSTNSKNLLYVIEVDTTDLDVTNGFDCFRVGLATGVAMVADVVYILSGARYASPTKSALTD